MKRLLAFIPVTNENNLDRTALGNLTDLEVWKKLPNNAMVYNLDKNTAPKDKYPGILDFVENYNDEVFDGGWWSTVLEIPEEEIIAFEWCQSL